MKLIELSKTHYVIVDDSDVKEGDFVFDFEERLFYRVKKAMFGTFLLSCRKITHSTQPLDRDIHGFGYWSKNIIPLSLSEVEEALYGYSVEKIFEDNGFPLTDTVELGFDEIKNKEFFRRSLKSVWINGFKAAMELTKDRLFVDGADIKSLQDLVNEGYDPYDSAHHLQIQRLLQTVEVFIQSLLPKTEWEIEFDEQGKLKRL